MIGRHHLLVTAVLFSILVTGCDGHLRTLYLSESRELKTPWHAGVTTVSISGGQDIIKIVHDVAEILKLKSDPTQENSWIDEPRWKFRLSVTRKENGVWAVSLADWPAFQRSQTSIQAEEEIRTRLKQRPNNSLNPDKPKDGARVS